VTPADDFRDQMRAAYDATGAAWDAGPRRVYDALAAALLDCSPVAIAGALAVDAGAGTGAATQELTRRRARMIVAVDLSAGMLRGVATARTPGRTSSVAAVVGDVDALPLASGCADLTVAAFVLNHVADPTATLAELARVTKPDGGVLASVFGASAPHPSKEAIDRVAASYGFTEPGWYRVFKDARDTPLQDLRAVRDHAIRAGLLDVSVDVVVVDPQLSDVDLVSWRTGMAHLAPFIRQLAPARAQQLRADAAAAVAGLPALTLTMQALSSRAG
jgi:ubiquinone/menaquinone biosynthesis C-methylase UbiE